MEALATKKYTSLVAFADANNLALSPDDRAKIEDQKSLTLTLLGYICSDEFKSVMGTSNTYVLGGAPRNWYFGMPAKDIDVFLYVSHLDGIEEYKKDKTDPDSYKDRLSTSIKEFKNALKYTIGRLFLVTDGDDVSSVNDECFYQNEKYMLGQFHFTTQLSSDDMKHDVNFIILDEDYKNSEVMEQFSCNMSKFAFEGGSFTSTAKPQENKIVFTADCSVGYRQKILEYFKDVDVTLVNEDMPS